MPINSQGSAIRSSSYTSSRSTSGSHSAHVIDMAPSDIRPNHVNAYASAYYSQDYSILRAVLRACFDFMQDSIPADDRGFTPREIQKIKGQSADDGYNVIELETQSASLTILGWRSRTTGERLMLVLNGAPSALTDGHSAIGQFEPALLDGPPAATRQHLEVVRDESLPASERAEALWKLIGSAADSEAPMVVAQELGRRQWSTPERRDWNCEVVLAAHELQFHGDMRERVTKLLRDFAIDMRNRPSSEVEPAVLAAIRTYASMIEPRTVDVLVDFLDPKSQISTTLTALRSIQRVLEVHPPARVDAFPMLTAKIDELASDYTKAVLLHDSKNAAIAASANVAFLCTAPSRVESRLGSLRDSGHEWFCDVVADKLRDVLKIWTRLPSPPSEAVSGVLKTAIDTLSTVR
ncbi:MAG: hypothetical protein ACKVZJ_00860 [Phycisphaerales bacterium]